MNSIGAIIASGLVYLLPFFVGSGVVVFWHAIRNHRMSFSDLLFAPLLGSLAIFILAAVTFYPSTLIHQSFLWANAFPVIVWALAIISILGILFPFRNKVIPLLLSHLWTAFALILISTILSFFIWSWRSPYPLNWDLYEHQTLVNAIHQGNFSLSTGKISDTFGFGSYPPFFHILLASAQHKLVSSPEEIASFWQWSSFWQAIGVGLASYAFTFAITKRRLTAGLAAIMSGLIFDSSIAFTSLFLLPQNMTAVFATLLLAKVAYDWRIHRHTSLLLLFLSVVTLIVSHYVIGFAAAILVIGWWFCLRFSDIIEPLSRRFPLIETLLIGGIAINLGASGVNLSFLNKGEGGDYVFSAATVSQFLAKAYGNSWLILLPLACKKYFQKRDYLLSLSLLIFFCFCLILTTPLPYMFKFFVLGRFWLILCLAIGLATVFEYIRTSLMRIIGVSVVICGFSLLLVANSVDWKHQLSVADQWTHLSSDDIAVATYLKANYPPSTLIISDPGTQYILEGLSGLNSPGGAFESTENRDILANALLSNTPDQLADSLDLIQDGLVKSPERLFVFSGRTWRWMSIDRNNRNSFSVNIWSPVHQSWLAGVYAQKLLNSQKFTLVLETATIWVFSLK